MPSLNDGNLGCFNCFNFNELFGSNQYLQNSLVKQVVRVRLSHMWMRNEHIDVRAWESESGGSRTEHECSRIWKMFLNQTLNCLEEVISSFNFIIIDLNPLSKLNYLIVVVSISDFFSLFTFAEFKVILCLLVDKLICFGDPRRKYRSMVFLWPLRDYEDIN